MAINPKVAELKSAFEPVAISFSILSPLAVKAIFIFCFAEAGSIVPRTPA